MSNDNYLITLAIPTYKHDKYLINLLDSISVALEQYHKKYEIEILISDDDVESTIEKDILPTYRLRGLHINYVKQKQQLGPDRNFMYLFKHSKGKYTILLHDYWIFYSNAFLILLNENRSVFEQNFGAIVISQHSEKTIKSNQIFDNLSKIDNIQIFFNRRILEELFQNFNEGIINGFCVYHYFFLPYALSLMEKKKLDIKMIKSKIIEIQKKEDAHLPYQAFVDHTFMTIYNLKLIKGRNLISERVYKSVATHYIGFNHIRHMLVNLMILSKIKHLDKSAIGLRIYYLLKEETINFLTEVNKEIRDLTPPITKIVITVIMLFYKFELVQDIVSYLLEVYLRIRKKRYYAINNTAATIIKIIKEGKPTYWERAGYEKSGIPEEYIKKHKEILIKLQEIVKNNK